MAADKLNLRPNSKEQRLDKLLEGYADVCPVPGVIHLDRGGSSGKAGSRPLHVPREWTDAHWELDRALARMIVLVNAVGTVRPQYREMHDHLRDWYFRVERRRVKTERTNKKGVPYHVVKDGQPQYHVKIIRTGDPLVVSRALTWMTLEFDWDRPKSWPSEKLAA